MAVININTAKARIQDLEGQLNMARSQIKDLLTDKRVVDEEISKAEAIIGGKGADEATIKS